MMRLCPSCGDEFRDTDNGLFVNCTGCRKPRDPKEEARRRARLGPTSMSGHSNNRDADARENTRETKFGVDR